MLLIRWPFHSHHIISISIGFLSIANRMFIKENKNVYLCHRPSQNWLQHEAKPAQYIDRSSLCVHIPQLSNQTVFLQSMRQGSFSCNQNRRTSIFVIFYWFWLTACLVIIWFWTANHTTATEWMQSLPMPLL